MFVIFLALSTNVMGGEKPNEASSSVVRDKYGAIVRGDERAKKLALVFTGDLKGESGPAILDTLAERNIKAGLFITGNFMRRKQLRPIIVRAIDDGHYVGPHSDGHLLYAPWDDRDESLVTKAEFQADLKKNVAELKKVGALKDKQPVLFIPPYEWYNGKHVNWSKELGVTLINFTPGSGSNRDYAAERDPKFVPSNRIFDDILAYEQKDPHGLNGFLLLLHLGSGRKDPFHRRLGPLCDELANRGYKFVRVDELVGRE